MILDCVNSPKIKFHQYNFTLIVQIMFAVCITVPGQHDYCVLAPLERTQEDSRWHNGIKKHLLGNSVNLF